MRPASPRSSGRSRAGNSSPLSDGSAAVLITTSEVAKRLGLRPLARIHTTTVVGSDPLYMLTGVIPATEKVLQRAGLTLADIDLFEVNEAFAPVVLAWAHDIGADLAKTNVNGGAIAIGHPLGASGARIMTTMVNALEQRGGRYGLQTMCEARRHGQRHHHRAAVGRRTDCTQGRDLVPFTTLSAISAQLG